MFNGVLARVIEKYGCKVSVTGMQHMMPINRRVLRVERDLTLMLHRSQQTYDNRHSIMHFFILRNEYFIGSIFPHTHIRRIYLTLACLMSILKELLDLYFVFANHKTPIFDMEYLFLMQRWIKKSKNEQMTSCKKCLKTRCKWIKFQGELWSKSECDQPTMVWL